MQTCVLGSSYRSSPVSNGRDVAKRAELVKNFSDPTHKLRLMPVGTGAGSTGIDLVGADIIDLSLNPYVDSSSPLGLWMMLSSLCRPRQLA